MEPPVATPQRAATRRRRPLNVTRIKSWIVLLSAGVTAFVSALTGLGPQAAYAPMLTWMLGFAPEKATASALRYAAFAAMSGVIGGIVTRVAPAGIVPSGLLLLIGATFGAVLLAPLALQPFFARQRRIFQSLGVVLTLFTLVQASHVSPWTVAAASGWHTPLALVGLGFSVGAITQLTGLPGGMLMVPVLYFLAHFHAKEAVLLSLMVVALAAALPAWSQARREQTDRVYMNWAIAGGIAGGLAGGMLLGRLMDMAALMIYAVVAMFLCGRELARNS